MIAIGVRRRGPAVRRRARLAALLGTVLLLGLGGCTSRPKIVTIGGCLYGGGKVEDHDGFRVEVSDVWTTVGFAPTPGQRGPLVMIGDSLTAWSINETMTALIGRGFGPICVEAVPGRQARRFGEHVPSGVQGIDHVRGSDRAWRASAVTWVVSLGTNDLFHTSGDPTVMSGDIEAVVSAIGSTAAPIRWVNVRTELDRRADEDTWNRLLATNRSITVIDWSEHVAALPASPFVKDKIHIRPGALSDRATFIASRVRT